MNESECVRRELRWVKFTQGLLDVAVDCELTCSQSTHHEKTGWETSKGSADTKLTGNLDKSRDGALSRQTLCLVDLRQHSISRLGDDGSTETGEKT